MKKHNRNILAYLRNPHPINTDEQMLCKIQNPTGSHTIYNDLIDQLDPDQNTYLQKMVTKAEKQEALSKKISANLHESPVSYPCSLPVSPSKTFLTMDKNEVLETRDSFKKEKQSITEKSNTSYTKHQKSTIVSPWADKSNTSFLTSLDSYVDTLIHCQPVNLEERRTVQKYRRSHDQQMEKKNLNLIKQLKGEIRRLKQQNCHLTNTLKNMSYKSAKSVCAMEEERGVLVEDIKKRDQQIEQFEQFFDEIQAKFSNQRKKMKRTFEVQNLGKLERKSRKSRKSSQPKQNRSSQERRVHSNLAAFDKVPLEFQKCLLEKHFLLENSKESQDSF